MKKFKLTTATAIAGIFMLLAVLFSCENKPNTKESILKEAIELNKRIGGQNELIKKLTEPKTISPTQEQLMVIYENGYIRGKLNEAKCKSEKESKEQWRKDSLDIVRRFFK